MIKPGDTVRYLNDVGGGVVIRVEGAIAYVDDDGFETPVRASELVVVMPAGHKSSSPGRKFFDQKAFDIGRSGKRPETPRPEPANTHTMPAEKPEDDFPIEETEYGDDMTVVLAFEPANVKKLSETPIALLLVNDSNFFLDWQLLVRDGETGWKTEHRGCAAPNELMELGSYDQQSVKRFERLVFQAIAYKQEKAFEVKTPLSVSRKVDLMKFYKLHCFRPTTYFETPVLEVPLLAETSRLQNTASARKSRH